MGITMNDKENLARIKEHLLPLWGLLPHLEDRINEYEFWLEFEGELRAFLNLGLETEITDLNLEDAYQNLLIEIYKRPDKFNPRHDGPTLLDSFFQKISLIRIAYQNHIKKMHRSDLAEDIRVLEYKRQKYSLTSVEEKKLENLKIFKKKL